MSSYPFTLEEFRSIYSKVPRLTVDLVIKNENGMLLTLRKIKPWKDFWHLPGGTIYVKETIDDAIQRVALDELGVKVTVEKFLGFIEFLHQEEWFEHVVSLAFQCTIGDKKVALNEQASEVKFFTTLPENMVTEQKEFLEKTFML